jgi:hypothetical protein
LEECSTIAVEEAEPRQHYLLTRCWLAFADGNEELACESRQGACEVFSGHTRVGDHTPHLVGRLARLPWSPVARRRVHSWQVLLNAPLAG